MAKAIRARCLSIVRRYQLRLLEYRVLRTPSPPPIRWVIVKAIGKSKPSGYFRYHPDKVWCWTTSLRSAHIFRTQKQAESAAASVSMWNDYYQIRQLV
jgi:hypothetical protein